MELNTRDGKLETYYSYTLYENEEPYRHMYADFALLSNGGTQFVFECLPEETHVFSKTQNNDHIT